MNDDRRRRRPNPELGVRRTKGNGPNKITPWLITIGAALAVIAGGWFLGQGLAHAFGGRSTTQTAQTQPSGVPAVTPLPSPSSTELSATPGASPQASPTQAPTPEPTRAVTPAPSPSPTPVPTQSPTAAPTPSPAPTATHVAVATTAPVTSHPTETPEATAHQTAAPATAPPENSAAERTVLAYIDALKRGDPQGASSYLGNGVPDESFIDAQTRVVNISQTVNGDGSEKVEVQLQTSQGAYSESFQVAPSADGSRILDKTVTKP